MPISAERSPKMLKDFLAEEANSISLGTFASFPRFPQESSMRGLIKTNLKSTAPSPAKAIMLLRSRSKAASVTISALRAMVKVLRAIPRTLSKQQSLQYGIENPKNTKETAEGTESKVAVRIKDIIRWRSFRDLAEEDHQLLKMSPTSPVDCTTATTLSTLSTSCNSSWCESDFSSDYSPPWSSNKQAFDDKEVMLREKFALDCNFDSGSMLDYVSSHEDSTAEDSLEKRARSFSTMEIESKRHTPWKENKGQSPVSVIDFEIGEDGEWRWSFKQSPAHEEIVTEQGEEDQDGEEQEPSGAEEKAMELLNQVRASTSKDCISAKCCEDRLLVDFFRSELTEGARFHARSKDEDYGELVKRAKSWVRGECDIGSGYEWGIDGRKEAYIMDMERREGWIKFEEDQEETVVEIESGVWSFLVDELLVEILSN
ncbi:hypothetical protein CDL15_Pgr003697 [Punica granatum]|nr:hypothetical protein CDL15_Pgr003697 [Punica granatum]